MAKTNHGKARTATKLDKHIGARIRELRLEQDVTQEALAAKLGITFQQVQKYELGKNRVAASRLYEIAVALSVGVGAFYPETRR